MNIGYYVHHHGTGHLSRALAIARHLPDLTLLGTGLAGKCGQIRTIELPDDKPLAGQTAQAGNLPNALHYAPLNFENIRQRAAILTAWIASHRPALLVVDVSVEIAMLARLASTPVLYIRLAGTRDDPAHLEAFRSAEALAAPFHPLLDDPETTGWVRKKTQFFPGLIVTPPVLNPRPNSILVILGTGGTAISGAEIAAAAAATPHLHWRVIGPAPQIANLPANLQILGWTENAPAQIAAGEIIIGAAGDGVVNAVLAAGRPFICIPQARPYDEQFAKGRRLAAMGVAITLAAWPEASDWLGIIAQARELEPAQSLHDPHGPKRAAEFIADLAARSCPA